MTEKKLVIASTNQGKLREFQTLLTPLQWQVESLASYPEVPEVIEDGMTFIENARKKAIQTAEYFGLPALADDSGLCVDALNGEPGVFSARYAGVHGNDQANNEKLLLTLAEKNIFELPLDDENRKAQFVCSLVYYDPKSRQSIEVEGVCQGYILDKAKGDGGFGYDPLFYIPQYGKSMAELTAEQKNAISHRGMALKKLVEKLR